MHREIKLKRALSFFLLAGLFFIISAAPAAQKKALTFQDVMKFKHVRSPVISEDGLWIAYAAQPDRGDGEIKIHEIKGGRSFTVERGSGPVISKNSRWVAMALQPKAVELEKADKKKPEQGMALVETRSGKILAFEKVQRFAFSDDCSWLGIHLFKEEEKPKTEEKAEKPEEEKAPPEKKPDKKEKKRKTGSTLILRHLDSGEESRIPYVLSFAFDSASLYLAFVAAEPEGKDNGLYCLDLKKKDTPRNVIIQSQDRLFSSLSWTKKGSQLAFLSKEGETEDKNIKSYSLWVWDGKTGKATQVVKSQDAPQGWLIPDKNEVSWSKDEKRLFFGFKPEEFHVEEDQKEEEKKKEEEIDLFDFEKILEKREVDVWHWDDPLINPNQKKMWPRLKDRTYTAVYHLDTKRLVPLADREMPTVILSENGDHALGVSDVPYLKERTWYGGLNDIYLVNMKDRSRKKIASRLEDRFHISPEGRFVVFYRDKHWFLFDGKTGSERNLTEKLEVPFSNEDHDYPSQVPSYGCAGWVEDDKAVLLYDKYDIWQFSTQSGQALNITAGTGRKNGIIFRLIHLDPEKDFLGEKEKLLVSAYYDLEKHYGFFESRVGRAGVKRLLEEKKRFDFLAKAKKADVLMYTRESYEEYPDIWVSDTGFASPKKVTDVNPQVSEFAWGSAELVEWESLDGIPLQGVLIKPGNYEPGKRYPVIIYFYRFFSQRLYEFNQVVVNHRPCFPFYASNGYAIFLPDIRFEVGRPGFAATKCLVPGVQKLIDMGIADPDAIGLHGHSWSGYQTAFIITQTDIFACAVAGAPVSNMTSAYSGIRWSTGLARQFQYEKSQSRIGGSLWEYPERYIENSPVFFADRINTPLLIQFGDEDGAVPWYQGIELYLAMRRFGKDCVFLQYRGEPHHLQKYANKLDYSIKMKEYFDHYLKGLPAPDWIKKGIPYRGK